MTAYGDFRGLLIADYDDALQNRFQKKNIQRLRQETTESNFFKSINQDTTSFDRNKIIDAAS